MKILPLKNNSYQYLEKAFGEWLDILGYAQMNTSNMTSIAREFLYFLDTQGVSHINKLEQKHYKQYFNYISTRSNARRGGGLSNNYLNKHIQALEKFYEFLVHKNTHSVPPVNLRQLKLNREEMTVLSQEEIELLYKAASQETTTEKEAALRSRDKAMLVVFYGCGLRRNEGVHLRIDDINFDTRVLHVRKGKNYKERFVPFSKTSSKHLQEWIYDHRPTLVKEHQNDALFINYTGKPMLGNSLYRRLKLLQLQTEDPDLQNKTIGLHTLRHSIATHLLQNGMELFKIQRFLGHSSLESTQIYTHLIKKEDEKF